MIRGSAGCFGIDTTKPKLGQIEFFDEDIDHANRIVLADPVFQAFRNARESYRGNKTSGPCLEASDDQRVPPA